MRWRADHPWQLVLGLGVWAVWFVGVYGGHALACRSGLAAAAVATLVVIGTIVPGVLLGWAAWRCLVAARHVPDGVRRFMARSSAALYAVAAVSTLFVGLVVWVVPACA